MSGRSRDGVDIPVLNVHEKTSGSGEPTSAWSEVYSKPTARTGAGDANAGKTDSNIAQQAPDTGDRTAEAGKTAVNAGPAGDIAGRTAVNAGPASDAVDQTADKSAKPANDHGQRAQNGDQRSWSAGNNDATLGSNATVTAVRPTAEKPISFGTDRTIIYLGDGQYQTIEHNPPREARDVLRDQLRLWATQNGELQPRQRSEAPADAEPTTDGTRSGVPAEKLVGFFTDRPAGENPDRSLPIRVLNGQTIATIMSGKPFGDVGDFGVALYKQAFLELQKEGKFKGSFSDDGSFNKLENMFAEKVAKILPDFRKNWPNELTQADKDFIRVTETPVKAATDTGHGATSPDGKAKPNLDATSGDTKPAVPGDGRPQEAAEAGKPLAPEITPNVLDKPLINERLTPDMVRTQDHTGLGADRSDASSDKSIGQFTDLEGNRRSIIRLNDQSIMGLLRQPGVLPDKPGGSTAAFDAAGFAELGRKAADYRNSTGIPGPEIGPASAELYVRIFRAMGLTRQDLLGKYEQGKGFTQQPLGPSALGGLFDRYLVQHSPEAKAVVNAGAPQRPQREVRTDRAIDRNTTEVAQDGTRQIKDGNGSIEGLSWRQRLNDTEMQQIDERRADLERRVTAKETLSETENRELEMLRNFDANRNNPEAHKRIIAAMGVSRPEGGFTPETLAKGGFSIRGAAGPIVGASFLMLAVVQAQAATTGDTGYTPPRRATFQ